jgi:CheY-like chemotaxis protein
VEGQPSRSFEGSGIGLALVQELIRLHGGTISVDSQRNRGTAFKVAVPFGTTHLSPDRIGAAAAHLSASTRTEAYIEEVLRWLPDPPASGADSASESSDDTAVPLPAQSTDGMRVLIADDNADMRRYVARLLRTRCEVATATDGRSALECIRRRQPDLIISDVMMPGMDGFGLLRELRADPSLRHIPVILLSARAGEEARIEGLDAGADDYLTKPFSSRASAIWRSTRP